MRLRNRQVTNRAASHPDDPNAPLADRLMLALGMWPSYVDELGVEEVIEAAAQIKWDAHRFSMCSEDYGALSQRYENLKEAIVRSIDFDEDGLTHARFNNLLDDVEGEAE